jgi:hypothetical protein
MPVVLEGSETLESLGMAPGSAKLYLLSHKDWRDNNLACEPEW